MMHARCNLMAMAMAVLVASVQGQAVIDYCNACGTSAPNINDFSSRAAMEASGWVFGWDDAYDFLQLPNAQFCNGVPSTSYCGFQHPGDSLISLTLDGTGQATFSFGNSWAGGTVSAALNGIVLASANPRNLTVNVTFNFSPGDVLTLTEAPTAVHSINGITFSCPNLPPRWETTATAGHTRVCDMVTTCSSSQYQVAAATTTSDTVCNAITPCLAGLQYQTAAATSTTNAVCSPVTPSCTAGLQYQSAAPTATTDRVCNQITPCSSNQYQSAAATATSNTVCNQVSTCGSGFFTAAAATATTDAQCSPVSTCSGPGQYTALQATATSDAVCVCQSCTSDQAFQPATSGTCPVCSTLTTPVINPSNPVSVGAGGSNSDQITINARAVNMLGVDAVGWLKALQSQVQQLQLQNAQLATQVSTLLAARQG
eukprot:m.102046 g.102046  ORF g.102046 m.102046 type:complete len:428 (+) comp10422_c0_seq1:52-1335(+)